MTPGQSLQIPIVRIGEIVLDVRKSRAWVDGKKHKCSIGAWAFYLSDSGYKPFHAYQGLLDCLAPVAPSRQAMASGDFDPGRYVVEDWQRVLQKPTLRRTAETWVAAYRLHRSGLGPSVYGVVLVEKYRRLDSEACSTSGLIVQNVDRMPRKKEATDEDLLAAGVYPDALRSAVRQQRRGYVIDLNSVVGVMPIDAEDEIEQVYQFLLGSWSRTT